MAPLRGPQPKMPQSNKPTSTSFCSWSRLAKDWLSPTKKPTSISTHLLHLINRIHVLTFEGFGPKYWDTKIVGSHIHSGTTQLLPPWQMIHRSEPETFRQKKAWGSFHQRRWLQVTQLDQGWDIPTK